MDVSVEFKEIMLRGEFLCLQSKHISELQHETYTDVRKEKIYSDKDGNCWVEVETTVAPEINNYTSFINKHTLKRLLNELNK